jgi:hypothetical protein
MRLTLIHAYTSSHAICFELGPVNFCFKWRHRDGSIVEFSANGWFSDDAIIADRLSKMNQLYSSAPGISPAIRNWLQEECELIEVSPPDSSSC